MPRHLSKMLLSFCLRCLPHLPPPVDLFISFTSKVQDLRGRLPSSSPIASSTIIRASSSQSGPKSLVKNFTHTVFWNPPNANRRMMPLCFLMKKPQ